MSAATRKRGPSAQTGSLLGLLLMSSTAIFGCSVIVGAPAPDLIPCEFAGSDPCQDVDPSLHCVRGVCQETDCVEEICGNGIDDDCDGEADEVDEFATELCDGLDNDCDGEVDEDLDNDGDGFSGCNLVPPELFDCNDADPEIHPGTADIPAADEVCDGADNDCDGQRDEAEEGQSLCAEGRVCVVDRGGCVFNDCRLPEIGCPARHGCDTSRLPAACVLQVEDCVLDGCSGSGERCDPVSKLCIIPRAMGESCDRDSQCASELCVSTAALSLRSSDVGGATQICSAACCSDSNCPADALCWAPGTGARGCVLRSTFEGSTYGAPQRASCASSADCGPADECIGSPEDAYTLESVQKTSCGAAFNVICSTLRERCPSGLCIGYGPPLNLEFCEPPCGTNADCAGILLHPGDHGCQYAGNSGTGGQPNWLPTCAHGVPSGTGACTEDSDCRDDACVDGQCRATCCNDSQCPDGQCRPISIHGRWEMHCGESTTIPADPSPT